MSTKTSSQIQQNKNNDAEGEQSLKRAPDEKAIAPPSQKRQRQMTGEDLDLNGPETTVQGQLELNPHFTVEEAQVAAKKEYNRRNSARSRVRSKKAIRQLQAKCARLSTLVADLTRENEVLIAQVEFYKKRAEERSATSLALFPPPPPMLGSPNDSLSQQLLGRSASGLSLPMHPFDYGPKQRDGFDLSLAPSMYRSINAVRSATNSMPASGIQAPNQRLVPSSSSGFAAQSASPDQRMFPPLLSGTVAHLSPRSRRALLVAMLAEEQHKSGSQR